LLRRLRQFDFDRAIDASIALRRIEAVAPASGTMATRRLSVNDARDTVVTLLFSKRTKLDFSAASQTVSLSGEQGLSEEIPTNEGVPGGAAASLFAKSKPNSDNKSRCRSTEDAPSSNRIWLLLANSQSRQVKKR
jgi:hypothetical protein